MGALGGRGRKCHCRCDSTWEGRGKGLLSFFHHLPPPLATDLLISFSSICMCCRKGKGKWLLKPARIDRGQIRFSARWKVRQPQYRRIWIPIG